MSSGWQSLHRLVTCKLLDLADMICRAIHGLPSRGSFTQSGVGDRWKVLLVGLKTAGLLEDRNPPSSIRGIDIIIVRMSGQQLDLTICLSETAAGLKKHISSEWSISVSSLQLAIGSMFLRDTDVIAEFVSSTDRVVTAVVGRALRGMFVAVGVPPLRAQQALFRSQELRDGLGGKLVRSISVRMPLRACKINETLTDWRADRDFAVSMLFLEDLSRDEEESCHGCAVQCLAPERGSVVVVWVPRVRVPSEMASEVDLDVFLSGCCEVLGDALGLALARAAGITEGGCKRRKLCCARDTYELSRRVRELM